MNRKDFEDMVLAQGYEEMPTFEHEDRHLFIHPHHPNNLPMIFTRPYDTVVFEYLAGKKESNSSGYTLHEAALLFLVIMEQHNETPEHEA